MFLDIFLWSKVCRNRKIPWKKMIFFKGFGRFSVSRHFWIQEVSINRRNDQILWENHYFQEIFFMSPVYKHFLDSKVTRNRKTTKPLKKSLFSWDFPVSRHFWLQKKCCKTWETTISLEKNNYIQGILSFFLFLDAFWIQKCVETEKEPNPLKQLLFSLEV